MMYEMRNLCPVLRRDGRGGKRAIDRSIARLELVPKEMENAEK